MEDAAAAVAKAEREIAAAERGADELAALARDIGRKHAWVAVDLFAFSRQSRIRALEVRGQLAALTSAQHLRGC